MDGCVVMTPEDLIDNLYIDVSYHGGGEGEECGEEAISHYY